VLQSSQYSAGPSNGWPLSCGRHEAYHGRPTSGNPGQHRGSITLSCSAVSFSGVLDGALVLAAKKDPDPDCDEPEAGHPADDLWADILRDHTSR
jgi:hypothetical protein